MESPAFIPLVFNSAWTAPTHRDTTLQIYTKYVRRNRNEQRYRWTLDEIEFAASSRYEIGTSASANATADKPRNNRKGFTLTELLVVIVIILSITAMIVPAVHNARNSAKAAACSANMARILSAMAAYESMDESFPYGFQKSATSPPGGSVGNASYDPAAWWWFHFIDVYSGGSPRKPSVVKCPAKRFTTRSIQANILWGNYGVNLSICKEKIKISKTEFKGMPLSRSDVKSPDRTMLVVDSGYAVIKWHHATKDPPAALDKNKITDTAAYIPGLSINSQRLIFKGMEKDAIDGRHPGKTVNVGFVDGHVERRKADDLLVDSTGEPAGDSDVLWKPK